jgi:arylformamidase
MATVYRNYDREALDRQYDNSRAVPEHERYFERYRELSAKTRARSVCRLDVPYGSGTLETLDVFPVATHGAPTWVFVHGGWWRRLDKSDFSFIADSLLPAGISFVSVNYALAPSVTVPEIVREVRAATRWVFDHLHEWGGDPNKTYIGGHSVGGHLAALAALTDPVCGLTSVSGVHDVEPVFLSYVNDWARMRAEDVTALSPVRNLPARSLPLVACAGAKETDEFRRQTAILAQAWRARGYPVTEMYLEGQDHFSIVLELRDPKSPLTQAILAQCLETARR